MMPPTFDWNVTVRPLLAASHGNAVHDDLIKLAKCIVASSDEIFTHAEEFNAFYCSFSALATHYLCANFVNMSRSSIDVITEACKVLSEFFILHCDTTKSGTPILPRQLILILKSLCRGSGYLQRSDVLALTALMKSSAVPAHVRATMSRGGKEGATAAAEPPPPVSVDPAALSVNQATVTAPPESACAALLDSLVSPLQVGSTTLPAQSSRRYSGRAMGRQVSIRSNTGATNVGVDKKDTFTAANIRHLVQLRAGSSLLSLCLSLPGIAQFRAADLLSNVDEFTVGRFDRQGHHVVPQEYVHANELACCQCWHKYGYPSLLADLTVCAQVLSLPLLEPLTDDRLDQLVHVAVAATVALLVVSRAQSAMGTAAGTEEQETAAGAIVDKCIALVDAALLLIGTEVGQSQLQNVHAILSALLARGVTQLLAGVSQPNSSRTTCLLGAQKLLLHMLQPLIVDYRSQLLAGGAGTAATEKVPPVTPPDRLHRKATATLWQRFLYVNEQDDGMLLSTIFQCAHYFLQQALDLREVDEVVKKRHKDSSPSKGSDRRPLRRSSCEDDSVLGSSNESLNDLSDETSMLGSWFEEIVTSVPAKIDAAIMAGRASGPESISSLARLRRTRSSASGDGTDKKTPAFLAPNVTEYTQFMSGCCLALSNICDILTCLPPQSLAGAAWLSASEVSILVDLLQQVEACVTTTDPKMDEFLALLYQLVHAVVSNDQLPPNCEDYLLSRLGIDLSDGGTYPLRLPVRSLTVMGQLLLIQQNREKEQLRSRQMANVCVVWTMFVDRLGRHAISGDASDDCNVEHVQLMLFLFHSLSLMDKKEVLLKVAQQIVRVERSVKPDKLRKGNFTCHIARLVRILEYLLRNFYEPPTNLVDHVRANVFPMQGRFLSDCCIGGWSPDALIQYVPCAEVEESFRARTSGSQAKTLRPLFYELCTVQSGQGEPAQLDGLATNFLYASDVYPDLYDACVKLQAIGGGCGLNSDIDIFNSSVIHYTHSVLYRITADLVPSPRFIEPIFSASPPTEQHDPILLQHALRLCPRIASAGCKSWIEACFTKQGVSTEQTTEILTVAAKLASSQQFVLGLIKKLLLCSLNDWPKIDSLRPLIEQHHPSVTDLARIDLIVGRLHSFLELALSTESKSDDKSEIEKSHSPNNVHVSWVCVKEVLDLLYRVFLLAKCHLIDKASDLSLVTYSPLETIPSIDADSSESQDENSTTVRLSQAPLASPEQIGDNRLVASQLMSISSGYPLKISGLGLVVWACAPESLKKAVETWSKLSSSLHRYPTTGAWRTDYGTSQLPLEAYWSATVAAQNQALSSGWAEGKLAILKHTLVSSTRLFLDLASWYSGTVDSNYVKQVLTALTLDVTGESLADATSTALESFLYSSPAQADHFTTHFYDVVLRKCYDLITQHAENSCLDERVLHECLKFMELLLDKPPGRNALKITLLEYGNLSSLLECGSKSHISSAYCVRLLCFFSKIFQMQELHPHDSCLNGLASTFLQSSGFDVSALQKWLQRWLGDHTALGHEAALLESRAFLNNFSNYISRNASCASVDIATSLLQVLLQVMTDMTSNPNTMLIDASQTKQRTTAPLFAQYFDVALRLASAGSGNTGTGHLALLKSAVDWFEVFSEQIANRTSDDPRITSAINECTVLLLSYVTRLLSIYRTNTGNQQESIDISDQHLVFDGSSGVDDDLTVPDNDESDAESEPEDLGDKLCSFTMTAKEFMNQHWYHCHTCGMVNGEGVCTVCAKVCHKGHDLSYSKFGSFFCDCGAKQDGTCLALTKRTAAEQSGTSQRRSPPSQPASSIPQPVPPPAVPQRAVSVPVAAGTRPPKPTVARSSAPYRSRLLAGLGRGRRSLSPSSLLRPNGHRFTVSDWYNSAVLDGVKMQDWTTTLPACREMLHTDLAACQPALCSRIVSALSTLLPALSASSDTATCIGGLRRLHERLERLHAANEWSTRVVEDVATVVLTSPEGSIENVRLSTSGEAGTQIRQRFALSQISRRALAVVGCGAARKRQWLVVAHDKGKLSIFQLGTLLKQASDNASSGAPRDTKKKLGLNRAATTTLNFSILTLCSMEDLVVATGLRDIALVTVMPSSGAVVSTTHIPLKIEGSNFIIRALWLPGSRSHLVVVTADFVVVYDVSSNATMQKPEYNFALPMGKVRDVTVASWEDRSTPGKMPGDVSTSWLCHQLIILSSAGILYAQELTPECAQHADPYYVTNTLVVDHADLKAVDGQVNGGGESILYSPSLELLCISYQQTDRTYVCVYKPREQKICRVHSVAIPQSSFVVRWSEATHLPGLIYGVASGAPATSTSDATPTAPGSSNNASQPNGAPFVLSIGSSELQAQNLKGSDSKAVLGPKAKLADMLAISVGNAGNFFVVLTDDGALRICAMKTDLQSEWLQSTPLAVTLFPAVPGSADKRAPSSVSSKAPKRATLATASAVDYFEHCTPLSDVDFGGRHLLHVYNWQQLKHRLNTNNLYIGCRRAGGFTLEIKSTDTSKSICGIRVEVGKQSVDAAPSYIQIFGRQVPVSLAGRGRWVDIPFSKEETSRAASHVDVTFGPPLRDGMSGMVFVDSVRVYGSPRDDLSWMDEQTESEVVAQPPPRPLQAQASTTSTFSTDTSIATLSLPKHDDGLAQRHQLAIALLDTQYALMDVFGDAAAKHKTQLTDLTVGLISSAICPTPLTAKAKQMLLRVVGTEGKYAELKHAQQMSLVASHLQQAKQTLDVDLFSLALMLARNVAAYQPEHVHSFEVIAQLTETFLLLRNNMSVYPKVSRVDAISIARIDCLVRALVDVTYRKSLSDPKVVGEAAKIYSQLLLSNDSTIRTAAKQAICQLVAPWSQRKQRSIDDDAASDSGRVQFQDVVAEAVIPDMSDELPPPPEQEQPPDPLIEPPFPNPFGIENDAQPDLDVGDPEDLEALLAQDPEAAAELLAAVGAASDSTDDEEGEGDDEEEMMALAIALSLQDQQRVASGEPPPSEQEQIVQALAAVNAAAGQGAASSDTTASPIASVVHSDDEGSTAATDGSARRTAAEGDSVPSGVAWSSTAPSESGASQGAESASGSERHFTEHGTESAPSAQHEEDVQEEAREDAGAEGGDSEAVETERRRTNSAILSELEKYLPSLHEIDGVRAVPLLQVLSCLYSNISPYEESERTVVERQVNALVDLCNFAAKTDVASRSNSNEVSLVLLRLFSLLLGKSRTITRGAKEVDKSPRLSTAVTAASVLVQRNVVSACARILQQLLPAWPSSESGAAVSTPPQSPSRSGRTAPQVAMDMSGFFQRAYVKEHADDLFLEYVPLLAEICLRLPYQIKRVAADSPKDCAVAVFDDCWYDILCECLTLDLTNYPAIRRNVRKLFLAITKSKEHYRQLRDTYALNNQLTAVRQLCGSGRRRGSYWEHDELTQLIEHLKYCVDVSGSRSHNWQQYCVEHPATVTELFNLAFLADDSVLRLVLQLVLDAISERGDNGQTHPLSTRVLSSLETSTQPPAMTRFVRAFLVESSVDANRALAHKIVAAILKNATPAYRDALLRRCWSELWPLVPQYGRRASGLVDLLGFFTLQYGGDSMLTDCAGAAVNLLDTQIGILKNHPNVTIYDTVGRLFDKPDWHFLEQNSCSVCNSPEQDMSSMKLASVKSDTRFTTSCQIVKLNGSYEISKITLRLTEIKRAKMIRKLSLYYSNKAVSSVVDLKNKPEIWSKPCHYILSQNQTEVKMEFALPITACNLMLEFVDFYTQSGAPGGPSVGPSGETLQCPRCSANVPTNPGVCGNCGENVFQCHKCRSINYDEKDPFLCNSCGFCKYAKFDFSLLARTCIGVDAVLNEDDRKKALAQIGTLLEKADGVNQQLRGLRPQIENCVAYINGQNVDVPKDIAVLSTGAATAAGLPNATVLVAGNQLNNAIAALIVKYGRECKQAYEQWSQQVQRIAAVRKEILRYDQSLATHSSEPPAPPPPLAQQCYGCITTSIEQCLLLLRAMVTGKTGVFGGDKAETLIAHTLSLHALTSSRRLTNYAQALLSALSCGRADATTNLCRRIEDSLLAVLDAGEMQVKASQVQNDLDLLTELVKINDSFWQIRLQCVLRLYLRVAQSKDPAVTDHIAVPCLRIINNVLSSVNVSGQAKARQLASLQPCTAYLWLYGKQNSQDAEFRMPKSSKDPADKQKMREAKLTRKYADVWKSHCKSTKQGLSASCPNYRRHSWLAQGLFARSSVQLRLMTADILRRTAAQGSAHKASVIDLLTKHLDSLNDHGPVANEFIDLYLGLLGEDDWKLYVAQRGLVQKLVQLVGREIERLDALENCRQSVDLTDGCAMKAYCELLDRLFSCERVRRRHSCQSTAGALLHAFLSLRRLLLVRSAALDAAQARVLELLDALHSGPSSDHERARKHFVRICISTLAKCSRDDWRTPTHILERICSIVYPEEKAIGEFFLNIEKDPAQEDFLQGRMNGNPYSSTDPAMGPLMREVKNKICRDCDLVTLLEDDTGMELLVDNKIMSLDLPVASVYRHIWEPTGSQEPMLVIYRMRGLLGDATEEFIERLGAREGGDGKDDEVVYAIAGVMSECGGLEAIFERLGDVRNLEQGQLLVQVVLKLLEYCMKVSVNRQHMLAPSLRAVPTFLSTLRLAIDCEHDAIEIATKLLELLNRLLAEAVQLDEAHFKTFSATFADSDMITWLLSLLTQSTLENNPALYELYAKALPNLAIGSDDNMNLLVNHFKPYLEYNKFDYEHSHTDTVMIEAFCALCESLLGGPYSAALKTRLTQANIVQDAAEYLMMHCPTILAVGSTFDSPEWKEFLSKPALKYVLRLLAGMGKEHEPSQMTIVANCIPIIHRLEQVSSEQRLGTLAENLLEVLRQNPKVAERIEEVRRETRDAKRRMAHKMRAKQLQEMGMKADAKGQVRVESPVLRQMSDLAEDSALVCSICREGYKFQPQKVLGIYTFSKRVQADTFDLRAHPPAAYLTVTHFNVVHIDCHQKAVRSARGREEWESAMLHNANTRCNGILPFWGAQVVESNFAASLAKYNNNLKELTQLSDTGWNSTVHCLRLLLLRFAQELSFSEDSGGGGRDANIRLVPYFAFHALYVLNSCNGQQSEERCLNTFLDTPGERWLEMCFEADSPLYFAVTAHLLLRPFVWREKRLRLLQRLLVCAHARAVAPNGLQGQNGLQDRQLKDYQTYRPTLLLFALLNKSYDILYQNAPSVDTNPEWSRSLATYIRQSDAVMVDRSAALLRFFEDDLLPAESADEWLDVCGIRDTVEDWFAFAQETLMQLPQA